MSMEKVNQFAQIGARTTATENDQVSNEEENVGDGLDSMHNSKNPAVEKQAIRLNDTIDTERDEEEDAFDQFILDAAENETIGKEVDDGDMDSGKENSSGSSGSKRRRDLNLMDKEDDEDDLTVRSTRRLSQSIELQKDESSATPVRGFRRVGPQQPSKAHEDFKLERQEIEMARSCSLP